MVDAFDKGSYVKVIPAERKIVGYSTRNSKGVPENFKNYFVIVFDKPFANAGIFSGDSLDLTKLEMQSAHAGAVVGFKIFKKASR